MYSFSSFKNKPVYLKDENIGKIYDIVFSKIDEKVLGFIIKKNILEYIYIDFSDIEKFDSENIFINSISGKNENMENYEIIGKGAFDMLGTKLGIVDDIEFHALNQKLLHIQLDINKGVYLISRFSKQLRQKNFIKIQAKNIIKFEDNGIIIKTNNTLKESKKILDNLNKIFINIGVAIKKV